MTVNPLVGENYITALISRQLYHWLQLKSQQFTALGGAVCFAVLACAVPRAFRNLGRMRREKQTTH